MSHFCLSNLFYFNFIWIIEEKKTLANALGVNYWIVFNSFSLFITTLYCAEINGSLLWMKSELTFQIISEETVLINKCLFLPIRFEIKQKLKTAKKKEKEEKKKKQEEEQEKRKLSQVPDTQVVSKLYSQQAFSKIGTQIWFYTRVSSLY